MEMFDGKNERQSGWRWNPPSVQEVGSVSIRSKTPDPFEWSVEISYDSRQRLGRGAEEVKEFVISNEGAAGVPLLKGKVHVILQPSVGFTDESLSVRLPTAGPLKIPDASIRLHNNLDTPITLHWDRPKDQRISFTLTPVDLRLNANADGEFRVALDQPSSGIRHPIEATASFVAEATRGGAARKLEFTYPVHIRTLLPITAIPGSFILSSKTPTDASPTTLKLRINQAGVTIKAVSSEEGNVQVEKSADETFRIVSHPDGKPFFDKIEIKFDLDGVADELDVPVFGAF